MQKKLVALALLSGAMILASCGNDNPPPAGSTGAGTSQNTSSESSGSSPITGKGIDISINGPLIASTSRSVYVTFDSSVKPGEVVFESSDPAIAEVVDMAEIMGEQGYDYTYMPEGYVKAKSSGTFALRAYLKSNPSVEVKRYFDVKSKEEGDPLPAETFQKLTSSMKVETTQEQYIYDLNYNKILDNQYELTTIFEETGAASTDAQTGPRTDAYSFTEKNVKTGKTTDYRYVRTSGNKVGQEYIDLQNRVASAVVIDGEGQEHAWGNSAYTNFFGDPEMATADSFVSFDGGSTYHLVADYMNASYLCFPLFLAGFVPDDFVLMPQKDGTIDFHVNVDPTFDSATKENNRKFGQVLNGTFSEFGTAEFPHLQPYAHEAYHDDVETTLKKMANLKNYQVHFTFDYSSGNDSDIEETIVFNEDTILETSTIGGVTKRTGIRKIDDTHYYKYKVEDGGQVVKTANVNAYWHSPENRVVRYPDFRMASEIFEKNSNGSYQTRGLLGAAITYMSYLPAAAGYADYENPTVITLSPDGYVASASTTSTYFDEEVTINIEFSAYENASHGLDFDNVIDDVAPTTWAEDPLVPQILVKNMLDWTVEGITLDQVLPYAQSSVGYNDAVGWLQSNPTYCYVETKRFLLASGDPDQEAIDAFIAKYQETLTAAGYVATAEKDADNNNGVLYENAQGYRISVAQGKNFWNDYLQPYVRVMFHVDDAAKLVYADSSL